MVMSWRVEGCGTEVKRLFRPQLLFPCSRRAESKQSSETPAATQGWCLVLLCCAVRVRAGKCRATLRGTSGNRASDGRRPSSLPAAKQPGNNTNDYDPHAIYCSATIALRVRRHPCHTVKD